MSSKNESLRKKYVEISSQEEADKVYDYLESLGEKVDREWNKYSYNSACIYVLYSFRARAWKLTSTGNAASNAVELQLSEFLNYDEPKPKSKPKYKIGDIVNTTDNGWQFSDIDSDGSMNYCRSASWSNQKITDVKYSNKYNNWWYLFNNVGNWYSECSIKCKDKVEEKLYDIKVGDIVKCLPEDKSKFSTNAGVGWEKDLEFEVTRINDWIKYKIYFGGKNLNGVYSDAVALVKRKEDKVKEKPKLVTDSGYNIGDKVKVIDGGEHYVHYKEMFIKLGFKNTDKNEFNNCYIGTVFKIAKHESNGHTLIALNMDDGSQLLINIEGIKHLDVVEPPPPPPPYPVYNPCTEIPLSKKGQENTDYYEVDTSMY